MNTSKIKVLGLLSLPLLAIAVAVMVFAFNPKTDTTEAATFGAAMELSIDGQTGKVDVRRGTSFTVVVSATEIPADGYVSVNSWIEFGATGLTFKDSVTTWPDCNGVDVGGNNATGANRGCTTAAVPPLPISFHKGPVFEYSLNCPDEKGSHTILHVPEGDAPALTNGAHYIDANTTTVRPPQDSIDVNCVNAPTDTPTDTPPPIPRMSKSPALQNVWLVRQGDKVPPADCLSGTDVGSLSEGLGQEIVTNSPKGEPQDLAAFEFEVHYDNKKVCVTLEAGAEFVAAGAVCLVEDSNTKPQLEGVARIGCVTIGKGHGIDELVPLAGITVYPQPDVYSQAKPNQDNGVVVQINNVNCDLGDEQGHAIAIFSCDDADITFRYLEGDVDPNCVIDAIDAQLIAFRWGVEKGSLLYKDFMNLEPSNQQADNDIDINDLQFVYGRFGSTCEAPHPPQDPVNPKA